jgi:hypothetical protein
MKTGRGRCTEQLPQESYFPRGGVDDMFFPAAVTCVPPRPPSRVTAPMRATFPCVPPCAP